MSDAPGNAESDLPVTDQEDVAEEETNEQSDAPDDDKSDLPMTDQEDVAEEETNEQADAPDDDKSDLPMTDQEDVAEEETNEQADAPDNDNEDLQMTGQEDVPEEETSNEEEAIEEDRDDKLTGLELFVEKAVILGRLKAYTDLTASDSKKEEWATVIVCGMCEQTRENATVLRDLFLLGVEFLRTEQKVDRLMIVLPWLINLREIYTNQITGPSDMRDAKIKEVFEGYVKTLDIRAFRANGFSNSPPLYAPTWEEAQDIRARYAEKILRKYNDLRKILNHYEERISTRWHKKSQKQRRNILSENWKASYQDEPELQGTESINDRFRMDIAMLLGYEPNKPQGSHNEWPFISVEALAEKAAGRFPMMLHSRANNPPSTFWATDFHSTCICRYNGNENLPYMPSAIMTFVGNDTPENYGQLSRGEACGRAQGAIATFGIVIMKLQGRLYDFLVRCCMQIMQHEFTGRPLNAHSEFPDTPPVVPPECIRRSLVDAPYYRLPAVVEDINEIIELVDMRHRLAIGRLAAMREDPAYFHSCLHELAAHSPERILHEAGAPVSYDEAEFWKRTVNYLIFISIGLPVAWGKLLEFLKEVRTEFTTNPNALLSGSEELPPGLRKALVNLFNQLQNILELMAQHGFASLACSEPLREYFYIVHPSRSIAPRGNFRLSDAQWIILNKDEPPAVPNTLIQSFTTISKHLYQRLEITHLSHILVEVDRLIYLDDKGEIKSLMTNYVRERFDDYLVISQGLMQVNRFQPWAESPTFRLSPGPEDGGEGAPTADPAKLVWLEEEVKKACGAANVSVTLKRFFDKKLVYSVGNFLKKPSKQMGVLNQITERFLDHFWETLDGALRGPLAEAYDLPPNEVFPEPGASRFRTPRWDDEETQAAMREIIRRSKASKSWKPRGDLSGVDDIGDDKSSGDESGSSEGKKRKRIELIEEIGYRNYGAGEGEPTTGRAFLRPSSKKIKTHADPSGDIPEGEQPVQQAPKRMYFEVDERALAVVDRLWNTGPLFGPKTLSWDDLLHFMGQVGMSAERVIGSAWKFAPLDQLKQRGVAGSINFHQPHGLHPSYESLRIPRIMGGRLKEAFDWDGKNFVEIGGTAAAEQAEVEEVAEQAAAQLAAAKQADPEQAAIAELFAMDVAAAEERGAEQAAAEEEIGSDVEAADSGAELDVDDQEEEEEEL
ncbi:hypothetical protein N7456_011081 [Penicillium angulare]|uniref:Uncharacterized protein n=1 Tax=Penicillium angulare TaxID=116970 RepID=A0A9W9JZQ6_9EURO|nr:hypothetical protein N7456_011081 [Penicillium angulare]